jgi:hypothetical protein
VWCKNTALKIPASWSTGASPSANALSASEQTRIGTGPLDCCRIVLRIAPCQIPFQLLCALRIGGLCFLSKTADALEKAQNHGLFDPLSGPDNEIGT